jgi:surface protein
VTINVGSWDCSKVVNFSNAFRGCKAAEYIPVSGWNTSSATNLSSVFRECYKIDALDLSGWDVSKATDLRYAFSDCKALTYLDLRGWNLSKVTMMDCMFYGVTSLVDLYLGPNFFTFAATSSLNSVDFSSVTKWSKAAARLSLYTNIYDRKSGGLDEMTITLPESVKSYFTSDELSTIVNKGYIIS